MSDSSENYTTEDLETSGRDTEYEQNDESSEQEHDSSDKEDQGNKKKKKLKKINIKRERHHKSETGPKRKNPLRDKQPRKRSHASITEEEEEDIQSR